MPQVPCSSIRDSFLSYLSENTFASEGDGECVLTVPINTIDNRWVDVTVEERSPGFFLVHDSGKASNELFLQGVGSAGGKFDALQAIASRYAVDFNEGRFLVGCKTEHLQHSIWTVALCSGLAMTELLRHKPAQEDEVAKTAVGKIITDWGSQRNVRVRPDISVTGAISQHKFDFLAGEGSEHVAVNILNPGPSSYGRAQRYGYLGLDLQRSDAYSSYKKLAVLASPPEWSQRARRIVVKIADKTVEFSPTDDVAIFASMDELMGRAA